MKDNRVYRPVEPSDLPKIQEGKLKTFRVFTNTVGSQYLPARLISAKIFVPTVVQPTAAYVVDFGQGAEVLCVDQIVVDVTPEVRWIIWNLQHDRISGYMNFNKAGWKTKAAADNYLYSKLNQKYPGGNIHPLMLNYKIVSFEV